MYGGALVICENISSMHIQQFQLFEPKGLWFISIHMRNNLRRKRACCKDLGYVKLILSGLKSRILLILKLNCYWLLWHLVAIFCPFLLWQRPFWDSQPLLCKLVFCRILSLSKVIYLILSILYFHFWIGL